MRGGYVFILFCLVSIMYSTIVIWDITGDRGFPVNVAILKSGLPPPSLLENAISEIKHRMEYIGRGNWRSQFGRFSKHTEIKIISLNWITFTKQSI